MSPTTITPYDAFKPIRNLLRKYDSVSLARRAATKLHAIETKPVDEWRRWPPWFLLLLIKWGFEFGDWHYPLKEVAESDLARLVNKLHDFEGECGSPFLHEGGLAGLSKFLRTKAYQQFWMQGLRPSWALARPSRLFCHLPFGHPLETQFTQRFHLSMNDFIELAFLLCTWLAASPTNIQFSTEVLFANVGVPAGTKAAFTAALTLTPEEVKQFLTTRPQAVENLCFQLNEPSPLAQCPFLAMGQDRLVYSRRLFEWTMNHFFYDQAKLLGGSTGAELVAQILEQYVCEALASLGLPFYTETDLKRAFPSRKVTDFVLPCDDLTLMVEVKASEMRPSVVVFPANQQLINELRDSVIKAAVQGYSLANDLVASSADLNIPNRSEFFLFILTYRDMYLGPGQPLWDEFLGEAVRSKLESEGIDPEVIPPERIVVLSLAEWDELMSILRTNPTLLSRILNGMVVSNRKPESTNFTFGQHLAPYLPAQPELPYLDEESSRLLESVQAKFPS
jgi:hypothetical protein